MDISWSKCLHIIKHKNNWISLILCGNLHTNLDALLMNEALDGEQESESKQQKLKDVECQ